MDQPIIQMRTLIAKGLYGDNLPALLSLARESFHKNCTLYGTFIFVFRTLAEEFGEQALPTSRYEHIVHQMTQPLLDALNAESAPPEQLLRKLDALYQALFTL